MSISMMLRLVHMSIGWIVVGILMLYTREIPLFFISHLHLGFQDIPIMLLSIVVRILLLLPSFSTDLFTIVNVGVASGTDFCSK